MSDTPDENHSESDESEPENEEENVQDTSSQSKKVTSGFDILKLKFKKLVTFTHTSTNAKDELTQCQETCKLKSKVLPQECPTR